MPLESAEVLEVQKFGMILPTGSLVGLELQSILKMIGNAYSVLLLSALGRWTMYLAYVSAESLP